MLKNYYGTIFLLINVITLSFAFLKEQPAFLPVCNLKDPEPELTKCSTKQVSQLFSQLSRGIPGLKPQIQLDPFHVDRIILDNANTNAVSFRATLINIVIKGLENVIVKESKFNPKNLHWQILLKVPHIRLDADYDVDGRILILNLKGNGKMYIETKNMELTMFVKNTLYEKGGFSFFNTTSINVNLKNIDELKTELQNLFGGNEELERSTNAFFNENWRDVFQALRPLIKQTIEEILHSTLKRAAGQIPANFFAINLPKPEKVS